MKFKKFYLLNEMFNNWAYSVPNNDKEALLFDFYAMSLISPEDLSDMNMKMAFTDAKKDIMDQLVEDFKHALLYSLSSEFRHVVGRRPKMEWRQQLRFARKHFESTGESDFFEEVLNKIRNKKYKKGDQFGKKGLLGIRDGDRIKFKKFKVGDPFGGILISDKHMPWSGKVAEIDEIGIASGLKIIPPFWIEDDNDAILWPGETIEKITLKNKVAVDGDLPIDYYDWVPAVMHKAIKSTKLFKSSPQRLSDMFQQAMPFVAKASESSVYGGPAWGMIAKAYGQLFTVTDPGARMVLIDHIYDLQHNTDTVFNKVIDYYKNGYQWIAAALNFKRDIKSPFELYKKISLDLRGPFAYVMKMQNGITLESITKKAESEAKGVSTLRSGQKVKLKKFKSGEQFGGIKMSSRHMKFSGKEVTVESAFDSIPGTDPVTKSFWIIEDEGLSIFPGSTIEKVLVNIITDKKATVYPELKQGIKVKLKKFVSFEKFGNMIISSGMANMKYSGKTVKVDQVITAKLSKNGFTKFWIVADTSDTAWDPEVIAEYNPTTKPKTVKASSLKKGTLVRFIKFKKHQVFGPLKITSGPQGTAKWSGAIVTIDTMLNKMDDETYKYFWIEEQIGDINRTIWPVEIIDKIASPVMKAKSKSTLPKKDIIKKLKKLIANGDMVQAAAMAETELKLTPMKAFHYVGRLVNKSLSGRKQMTKNALKMWSSKKVKKGTLAIVNKDNKLLSTTINLGSQKSTDIVNYNGKKKSVFNHMLDILKKHFHVLTITETSHASNLFHAEEDDGRFLWSPMLVDAFVLGRRRRRTKDIFKQILDTYDPKDYVGQLK